jgi:hypothetical protein
LFIFLRFSVSNSQVHITKAIATHFPGLLGKEQFGRLKGGNKRIQIIENLTQQRLKLELNWDGNIRMALKKVLADDELIELVLN